MARRGRFGRRPRATGNLTGLVAQLYREQRAAEDRVMFDAYQNGGMVDGKPVDDKRIRSYIAARRDGFTKDDPLYDEWNNRLIQIDFRIGEEKVTLAFQQGKVGAGAVAAFYRQQLASIPKESAFYREVAGRAAQWAKAASSAARGAAGRKLTAGLEAKQSQVAKTWAQYSAIEDIVTKAAQRAGLIAGNQTLTDADASRLQDLFAQGIAGPRGSTITFDEWRAASVDAYKAFDVQISVNKQLNRGTKELTEGKQRFLDESLVRINTIDDRAAYEAAYDAMWGENGAVANAQGNPSALLEAAAQYAATLGAIKANAEKSVDLAQNDSEFIGGLVNEINAVTTGKATGPTVFDLQSTSGEGVVDNDGTGTAQSIAKVIADAKALDGGQAYYGQSEFGGQLGVVYYAPGASLDPFGRNGLGPDAQPALVTINGKPQQIILKGQPVKSSGLVSPEGAPVQTVNDGQGNEIPVENLSASQIAFLVQHGYTMEEGQTVGFVFNQGGKTTYGVYTEDGSLKFTDQNPWTGSLGFGEEGSLTVTTGANFDGSGEKIVVAAPALNPQVTDFDGLMVDPTVLPSDLRNLANNAPTESAAQALLDLAASRQAKTAEDHAKTQGELDIENRGQGTATPPGLLRDVTGFANSTINDILRDAIGVASDLPDLAGNVPGLGPMVKPPPIVALPPTVPSPTAAPSLPSPGSAVGAASAKLIDDLTSPPGEAEGSAVGGATAEIIKDLQNKGKGGGGTGGADNLVL